jgi:hypothetical protein
VFFSTREAAGALGARHSLRPLFSEGGTFKQNSRERRGEIAKLYLTVIASEAKQSTVASLLSHGLLRFARNDGLLFVITRESGRSSIPSRQ